MLTEFEKGWLSALIDGEGWMNLHKKKDRPVLYQAELRIYNTNKEILEQANLFLRHMAIIKVHTDNRGRPGRNICYDLMLHRQDVIYDLLVQIRPFLIVKRERCKKILDFLDRPRLLPEERRDPTTGQYRADPQVVIPHA